MNKTTLVSLAAALALAACSSTQSNQQTAQGTNPNPSPTQAAGDYVDDAGITTAIKANLLKDQALKGFDIHVETAQNVVQLSGFLNSPLAKTNAQRIAQTTKGVKSVKNDIIVRS